MIESFIFYYYMFVFVLLARDAIVRDMVYVACKSGSYLLIKQAAVLVTYISQNIVSYVSRRTRKIPNVMNPPYEPWTFVELT
jgi:hypothetical protein